jgi:lysophospholipase L1-like esterase
MQRTSTIILFAAVIVLGTAVAPAGAVDASRYVSLGDSLTAGVISASIGERGQLASYPRQFHLSASSGPFEQPLVSDPGLPARLTLKSLSPLVITPEPGSGSPTNLAAPAYQNLGVSGARVNDTLTNPGIGQSHALVLRGLGTALQQAVAQSPTLVSLWIGNNDVLRAATTGIVLEVVTLTPLASFEADFRAIADTLEGTGADLVFGNIPSVTAIPFVNTIPPVLVDPATQMPVLIGGAPVPLIGPDGPLGLGDKVLLPGGALLARGDGIPPAFGGNGKPLPDTVILNAAELATIETRLAAFNGVIATVASEKGAALVDINAIFDRIRTRGLHVGGVTYTTELFGGLFSFDGVHASPFGYAVITNELIKAINRHFGDTIRLVSYAPFMSGGAGNIGTDFIDTSRAIMTSKAQRHLRKVLDVPTPRRLMRLKSRWLAQQEEENSEGDG